MSLGHSIKEGDPGFYFTVTGALSRISRVKFGWSLLSHASH